ncbi:MAG: NAD/NADP octopine/nopaline dehydrogenase family protein [Gammaproteobacteria bacterium]|nr:NAD/NADP octopine/nopaline dehydrogenase family protein [Gammaproteobacteria bacterium]
MPGPCSAQSAPTRAYRGVRTPMVRGPDGHRPDFSHRFFAEDVPHGLVIARGVAEIAGVATPEIDRVLDWCQQIMGREYLVDGRMAGRDLAESAAPQAFGIDDADALIASVLPALAGR